MGLVLVSYAFKFALMAEMNQGCIPSLFTVTSFYIAILFYFKFGEVISYSKILGITMMVPCVILLSIDKKEESEKSELTASEMQLYGGFAVLMACMAPIFWTIAAYYARKTIERKAYVTNDLAIDRSLFIAVI